MRRRDKLRLVQSPVLVPEAMQVLRGQSSLTLRIDFAGEVQSIQVSTAAALALAADLMEGAVQLMDVGSAAKERSPLRLVCGTAN
jgi:hypothetical protein